MGNTLRLTLLISALAGVGGTGVGALIAAAIDVMLRRQRKHTYLEHFLRWAMSFSSGLMIAIICFDLLPESFEFGNVVVGLTAAVVGCMTMIGAEKTEKETDKNKKKFHPSKGLQYTRTGVLIAIGIAMHNFPEGLVVGSGFSIVTEYGIGLGVIIALHDIPEGMALAVPLLQGKMNPFKVVVIAMLTGVPTIVGAIIGWIIGSISPYCISVCLGFAGGAMAYVVVGQLIPLCFEGKAVKGTVFMTLLGLLMGVIISTAL
jgi:ZIP family zinc transporter